MNDASSEDAVRTTIETDQPQVMPSIIGGIWQTS
jgi:hypothetical protein